VLELERYLDQIADPAIRVVRFQSYFRPRGHFTILNNQLKKMLDRNRVIEYVAHIAVNSDDAVGSMERDCCVIKKVFLVFGEEKPLFLKGQRCVKRIRLSSVAKFPSAFDIHASRPDPLDRLFDLFADLFASVLLYIAMDRVFNKGLDQRRRRMEARRLRPRL